MNTHGRSVCAITYEAGVCDECPRRHPGSRRPRGPRQGGGRMTDLNGRTALVTGGASGIGAACARELAARGAVVTVADVDEAGAKDLAQDIGGQAWVVDLLNVSSL